MKATANRAKANEKARWSVATRKRAARARMKRSPAPKVTARNSVSGTRARRA
jgi:hypothetical protein